MGPLTASLENALKSAKTRPEDAAAVQLAREYARVIDESPDRDTLEKLGPKLQNILSALHMTPAGRTTPVARGGVRDDAGAAGGAGGTGTGPGDQLAELRSRAAARKNRAAPVDAATS